MKRTILILLILILTLWTSGCLSYNQAAADLTNKANAAIAAEQTASQEAGQP